MKAKLLTVLLLIAIFASFESRAVVKYETRFFHVSLDAPPTDTLLTYLSSLNVDYYIGKPVDSFFKKLPAGYSQLKVMSKDGSRYARYLLVKYDSIRVLIFVKEFHHLTPKNHNMNWDINLFKMENVACIEIWNRRRRITPQCKWWE